MITINTVGYAHADLQEQAQALAQQLNFSLDKDASSCLFFTEQKLALKTPKFSLLAPEFAVEIWKKRKQEGKKQGLIRACKPTKGLKIIDATAGWGRDAAILASFGAEVLMLERHPVMSALLANALQRRSELDKKQMYLSLYEGDAYSFLANLPESDYPDIIYIDPMHPERQKSALVKKDMQVLQDMIGADEDAWQLIDLARRRIKQKLVVKWPQKIPALVPTDTCIAGKTVRFDIYCKI